MTRLRSFSSALGSHEDDALSQHWEKDSVSILRRFAKAREHGCDLKLAGPNNFSAAPSKTLKEEASLGRGGMDGGGGCVGCCESVVAVSSGIGSADGVVRSGTSSSDKSSDGGRCSVRSSN